ncbi:MAG: hypothetical protein EOP21_01380 [Hyphomicrobiales bacterium]|nr:MAG: hypothetical protein EOP21_01380 [Hyphomicrobiales bacterium]
MRSVTMYPAHPAGHREKTSQELRATNVNGKVQMLPNDPLAVAKIFKERREKNPALAAKARMAAAARKRGI